MCTSVQSASKTQSKKSIILTSCTSTQRKRTKKELPNSYIKLLNYRHPIVRFYRKRWLGPDQNHYNQSRRWSWLQTTLAQITRIVSKWIDTVLKFFSQLTIFEQLPLAPKIFTALNVLFYCSGFLSNCACPENRVALKFFTGLSILLTLRSFEQLALALKIFTVWNILFRFRIFEQLALALKNRVALEFSTVLKYILSFRIFEQLALALKNRVAVEFFTVLILNMLFAFRIFEQPALALKHRGCPEFAVLNMYFLLFGFLSN